MPQVKQNFDIIKFDMRTEVFFRKKIRGWYTRVLVVMTQTPIFDWEPQKWLKSKYNTLSAFINPCIFLLWFWKNMMFLKSDSNKGPLEIYSEMTISF